jgi:hypothetical protein
VSKINLSNIPANLIDCLNPAIKPVWEYLSRDRQIHELEKARETLEWRQGAGKSWCEFVDNVVATQDAVRSYYLRQLFGRVLSIEEQTEYLCAEHGMTSPQALGITTPQLIEILRATCRKRGIPELTVTASRDAVENWQCAKPTMPEAVTALCNAVCSLIEIEKKHFEAGTHRLGTRPLEERIARLLERNHLREENITRLRRLGSMVQSVATKTGFMGGDIESRLDALVKAAVALTGWEAGPNPPTENEDRKAEARLMTFVREVEAQLAVLRILAANSSSPEFDTRHKTKGPRVVLRGRDEGPLILGKEKPPLTDRQYNVIRSLLNAGEDGLTKDKLDEKSGHSESRKVLSALRDSDPDWAAAIHMPGKAGRGGYRIK